MAVLRSKPLNSKRHRMYQTSFLLACCQVRRINLQVEGFLSWVRSYLSAINVVPLVDHTKLPSYAVGTNSGCCQFIFNLKASLFRSGVVPIRNQRCTADALTPNSFPMLRGQDRWFVSSQATMRAYKITHFFHQRHDFTSRIIPTNQSTKTRNA